MPDRGFRRVVVLSTVASLVGSITFGGASAEDRVFAVHISHGETARMVRHALEGAARRLQEPRCAGLIDRFVDAEGRTLRASLEKSGVDDGAAYLSLLIFYDGSRRPICTREGVQAAAAVGSRVVWICPEPFVRSAWRDPASVEVIVIHEALHSLGLGENPPSSSEINARVTSACR